MKCFEVNSFELPDFNSNGTTTKANNIKYLNHVNQLESPWDLFQCLYTNDPTGSNYLKFNHNSYLQNVTIEAIVTKIYNRYKIATPEYFKFSEYKYIYGIPVIITTKDELKKLGHRYAEAVQIDTCGILIAQSHNCLDGLQHELAHSFVAFLKQIKVFNTIKTMDSEELCLEKMRNEALVYLINNPYSLASVDIEIVSRRLSRFTATELNHYRLPEYIYLANIVQIVDQKQDPILTMKFLKVILENKDLKTILKKFKKLIK